MNSAVLKLNEAIDYHWNNKFRKIYGTFRSIEITDTTDRTDGPKLKKLSPSPVREGPVRLPRLMVKISKKNLELLVFKF